MSDYHENMMNNYYPEAAPEEWDEWQRKQVVQMRRYEILKRRFGGDGNALLVECPDGEYVLHSDAEAAIATAVQAERERCAKVCEDLANQNFIDGFKGIAGEMDAAAEKIRKGGAE